MSGAATDPPTASTAWKPAHPTRQPGQSHANYQKPPTQSPTSDPPTPEPRLLADLGLSGRVLGGTLDRLQHPLLATLDQPRGGVDQPTGLLGSQFGDPVGQHVQRLGVLRLALEPPFSPADAGWTGLARRGGPSRALHNASLTST